MKHNEKVAGCRRPPHGHRPPAIGFVRCIALLVSFVVLLPCSNLAWTGLEGRSREDLLETGGFSKSRNAAPPSEIRIVSFNIRYCSGDDLKKLIGLLRDDREIGGAAIIGLQEIDRNKKRSRNVHTPRALAEALGMNYAWAGQPPREAGQREEETGIALLSPFPMTDVERLDLPHAGPGGRRRVALGATVHTGKARIRVYVVHAERRIPLDRKMDQLRTVLQAVERGSRTDRVVVLGDLNSHGSVRETVEVFTKAGFSTPIPHEQPTLRVLIVETKLDWIWMRGLEVTGGGVAGRIPLSDHRPLWVTARL